MITYLLGDFLPYILGALGLVAAFFGIRWGGGKAARQKARAERAEADLEAKTTRERIEDGVSSDPDLAGRARRSVLRKRGE